MSRLGTELPTFAEKTCGSMRFLAMSIAFGFFRMFTFCMCTFRMCVIGVAKAEASGFDPVAWLKECQFKIEPLAFQVDRDAFLMVLFRFGFIFSFFVVGVAGHSVAGFVIREGGAEVVLLAKEPGAAD